MFGYIMHTSDDVLEDLMTHKIAEGRVPEADPTRAHLVMAMDIILTLQTKGYESWNMTSKTEANKDET